MNFMGFLRLKDSGRKFRVEDVNFKVGFWVYLWFRDLDFDLGLETGKRRADSNSRSYSARKDPRVHTGFRFQGLGFRI